MKTMHFIFLISLFVLGGCATIYGEKVLEQEKPFSENTVFEFELNEDTAEYKINLEISYQKTMNRRQGKFTAELINPAGKSQTRSFEIRNNERKTALVAYHETILFEITPETGKYTLKINENQLSYIKGKNIKLKVYKK